jgi:hypothetical protein
MPCGASELAADLIEKWREGVDMNILNIAGKLVFQHCRRRLDVVRFCSVRGHRSPGKHLLPEKRPAAPRMRLPKLLTKLTL